MGEVYEAKDVNLGRVVALKFLPPELAGDPRALARLRAEARTTSALEHPNISVVYEIDESTEEPFIVMERLRGSTLQHILEEGPLEISRAVKFGTQLATALDAAHKAGVLHRDLKPANVFIAEGDNVKVLDFALAKYMGGSLYDSRAPTLVEGGADTQTGVVGTPYYMSPEQVRGEAVDNRSDLFSFGVLLYKMVTGKRPFTGSNFLELSERIVSSQPVRPSDFNPKIPLALEKLINGCLCKDPGQRPVSAAALLTELERIVTGQGVDTSGRGFRGTDPRRMGRFGRGASHWLRLLQAKLPQWGKRR